MSAYEALHNKQPDISHLVSFGCIGVHHIHKDVRKRAPGYHPLDAKGKYVRVLGYGDNIRGTYILKTQNGNEKIPCITVDLIVVSVSGDNTYWLLL